MALTLGMSQLNALGRQINPFDGNKTAKNPYGSAGMPWGGAKDGWKNPFPTKVSTPAGPKPSALSNPDNSAYIASLNAQTAALRAQTAAMPRLPAYDILGSYNKAKSRAEADLRPHYTDMLNTFLAGQTTKTSQARTQNTLNKEQTAMERTNTRADNATSRTRTSEDTAAALQQLGLQETEFQSDEGTEFDRARRGLQESVAGAGLTTSGLGQDQLGQQQDDRNIVSERQVQQFEVQRQAKELFKNRTFADLERGDLRADETALLKNKQYDFDLDSELANLAQESTEYKQNWEVDFSTAVSGKASEYDRSQTAEFIASLAASGARAQDIAFAQQVYL